MKSLLFSILIFATITAQAQTAAGEYWRHLRGNIAPAALMLTAGASQGLNDAISHKYDQTLFARNPARAQFWDPDVSWRNKYANWPQDKSPRFFGSTTFLVGFTDAWHLTNSMQIKALQITIPLYQSDQDRRKWWWPVADVAASSLIYSAGWHLSEAIFLTR